ncbi:MazG nucleotide pyrophosphohydrolase domain-containing protein [Actinomadura litoris]|uniref:MazG nucleotide pyrophosphohydrolase domain-containing protein n=1 Tax=Actinomadura litoris TaxID=2678616 RepID=UPI001FA6F984|nr:MazG nucleotide pyrophosphohydrolase domain-containing protein [Actinomadura litoris]
MPHPDAQPADEVTSPTLADLAAVVAENIRQHFPADEERHRQVLVLAEEAGEFVGAYRRWAGMARRAGDFADVQDELADVVITACVTAHVLNIDLDAAWPTKARHILTRGRRDRPDGGTS